MTKKKFQKWAVGFTATVLKLITVIWGFCMIYAAVLMTVALFRTGEFSFLDTYITKVCECFAGAVITGLITRTLGNIFEFNDGGIFGISRKENNNDSSDCSISTDDMCDSNEFDH